MKGTRLTEVCLDKIVSSGISSMVPMSSADKSVPFSDVSFIMLVVLGELQCSPYKEENYCYVNIEDTVTWHKARKGTA